MAQEIEIKLRVGDAGSAARLLESAGFRVTRPRTFEANELYDFPAGELRARGELLRLRQYGDQWVLTFKGKAGGGRHKSREEIETRVDLGGAMEQVLLRLGLQRTFRYEKFRTEFQRAGESGHAVLDETPIGTFLELEGEPGWIDRAASQLGFSVSGYVTESYGGLYLDHCRRAGIAPSNMVFEP